MSEYDVILIDGNSVGHAQHNGTKLTNNGLQVQAIFGTLKAVNALARKYPSTAIMVLWDGRAQWRFDLHPAYKSNRSAVDEKQRLSKEAYKEQMPYLRLGLKLLGVKQVLALDREADDLAGFFSRSLGAAGRKVLMVSGDQDWIQLVSENATWHDPIRDVSVTPETLFDFSGYRTAQSFLEGKALRGDSSDCIPGVGGIGEKGAPEFLAEFGSVQAFLDQCDSGSFTPKKKAHQNLASATGRAAFARNMKLTNLINAGKPDKTSTRVIEGVFDREKFELFCAKFAFVSIIRELDLWTQRFERGPLKKAA